MMAPDEAERTANEQNAALQRSAGQFNGPCTQLAGKYGLNFIIIDVLKITAILESSSTGNKCFRDGSSSSGDL